MEDLETLVLFQRHLNEEEEFITKLLRQIDQQINSLQVEQMELQSTMYASENIIPKEEKTKTESEENAKLDLTVPINIKNDVEEEEEDEDEEL